jgi:hypothetical protein
MSHAQDESSYSSPEKTPILTVSSGQLLNKHPLCHLHSNYLLKIVFSYVSGHI